MSNINGDVDKLWEDADNDGNGFLDINEAPYFLDEICKMMHPSRAQFYDKSKFNELFEQFDEDNSNYLSKNEMANFIKKSFQNPEHSTTKNYNQNRFSPKNSALKK